VTKPIPFEYNNKVYPSMLNCCNVHEVEYGAVMSRIARLKEARLFAFEYILKKKLRHLAEDHGPVLNENKNQGGPYQCYNGR
jgi:hypothetical protein